MIYLKRSVITILKFINHIELKLKRSPFWGNRFQSAREKINYTVTLHVLSRAESGKCTKQISEMLINNLPVICGFSGKVRIVDYFYLDLNCYSSKMVQMWCKQKKKESGEQPDLVY